MLPSFVAFAAAASLLAGQTAEDSDAVERARLVKIEKEVRADLRDPALMADSGRATMVRLTIESSWKSCAATEAGAIARRSERAARLLAEEALTICGNWREALRLALDKGAYPYLDERVSREDMIAQTELEARDAAVARILRWRGNSGSGPLAAAPITAAPATPLVSRQSLPIRPRPIPQQIQPQPQPQEPPLVDGEEPPIVVVARLDRSCRVRFADRTLTEAQLAQKAREWAASGTTLRLVRPAGADYRCMSKIVWHLGEYGMRKFEFVEAADPSAVPAQR